MSGNLTITVFGGSGFLGSALVRALVEKGHKARVAVRSPDRAARLKALGADGQVSAVPADVLDPVSLASAVEGADGVVNLVGILYETGKQSFDSIHHLGAKNIAQAASDVGIARFVQVSAIGADVSSPSAYARSKAGGEAAALKALPDAVILRPSLVVGPEDDFFNQFADMAKLSPFLPSIGGGKTLFQPVFVGDVAQMITLGLEGALKGGQIYELGGPDRLSFKQLLEMTMEASGRKRLLAPMPMWAASVLGSIFERLPMKPALTRDQVLLLKRDNVVSQTCIEQGRTLEGAGIPPTPVSEVLTQYPWSKTRG